MKEALYGPARTMMEMSSLTPLLKVCGSMLLEKCCENVVTMMQ